MILWRGGLLLHEGRHGGFFQISGIEIISPQQMKTTTEKARVMMAIWSKINLWLDQNHHAAGEPFGFLGHERKKPGKCSSLQKSTNKLKEGQHRMRSLVNDKE
jgi:hypothetical protein